MNLIQATQRSARAVAAASRAAHALRDATRSRDAAAIAKAQRDLDRAKARQAVAYSATRFPWEV
jgi:hypothetical protein